MPIVLISLDSLLIPPTLVLVCPNQISVIIPKSLYLKLNNLTLYSGKFYHNIYIFRVTIRSRYVANLYNIRLIMEYHICLF